MEEDDTPPSYAVVIQSPSAFEVEDAEPEAAVPTLQLPDPKSFKYPVDYTPHKERPRITAIGGVRCYTPLPSVDAVWEFIEEHLDVTVYVHEKVVQIDDDDDVRVCVALHVNY